MKINHNVSETSWNFHKHFTKYDKVVQKIMKIVTNVHKIIQLFMKIREKT